MVKSLKVGNHKFEYPTFLFEYLQPYLERLSKTHSIVMAEEFVIPKTSLNEAISLINESLRRLVTEGYKEPTHTQRSKFPSRYQKIEFEGTVYVVDYRKDLTGKIVYALNYLLSWLQEKIESHA